MHAGTWACLAEVAGKVQVDEAGHDPPAARLKGPPPQAVVDQQRLQHKGQGKGAQKAAAGTAYQVAAILGGWGLGADEGKGYKRQTGPGQGCRKLCVARGPALFAFRSHASAQRHGRGAHPPTPMSYCHAPLHSRGPCTEMNHTTSRQHHTCTRVHQGQRPA